MFEAGPLPFQSWWCVELEKFAYGATDGVCIVLATLNTFSSQAG